MERDALARARLEQLKLKNAEHLALQEAEDEKKKLEELSARGEAQAAAALAALAGKGYVITANGGASTIQQLKQWFEPDT